jgi:hypothetical protein
VAGDNVDGSASTIFSLARKTYVRMPVIASSSPSSCRERWGWRRAGCGKERAAKVSGESGSGSEENAGIVDLSSKEPNMNGVRNCV